MVRRFGVTPKTGDPRVSSGNTVDSVTPVGAPKVLGVGVLTLKDVVDVVREPPDYSTKDDSTYL